MRKANYLTIQRSLFNLLDDMEILAGNRVPPSGVSMIDVIGTAKTNAQVLASQLDAAHNGYSESWHLP